MKISKNFKECKHGIYFRNYTYFENSMLITHCYKVGTPDLSKALKTIQVQRSRFVKGLYKTIEQKIGFISALILLKFPY